MKIQHCLSGQDFHDFDSGALPNVRHAEFAEHLESCAECAARYERLEVRPDGVLEQLRVGLPTEALAEDAELDQLVARAAALQQTSEAEAENTLVDQKSQRLARIAE